MEVYVLISIRKHHEAPDEINVLGVYLTLNDAFTSQELPSKAAVGSGGQVTRESTIVSWKQEYDGNWYGYTGQSNQSDEYIVFEKQMG
jgi:hypothetical protein